MKQKNLKNFTFIYPLRIDSIHRLENLILSTSSILDYFDTNIKVLECSSYKSEFLPIVLNKNIELEFLEDNDPIFYRTKHINYMIKKITTPYIAVWDTDVIAPKEQIMEAAQNLIDGKADFAYPYDKKFLDVSFIIRKLYLQNRNINLLLKNTTKMKEMYPPNPVGGAFMGNSFKYIESGMENEGFYGWGVEDGERIKRWKKLEYRIYRADGPLFHLTHTRGVNSIFQDKFQQSYKLKMMHSLDCVTQEDLIREISETKK